jgi:hypothetical protein
MDRNPSQCRQRQESQHQRGHACFQKSFHPEATLHADYIFITRGLSLLFSQLFLRWLNS